MKPSGKDILFNVPSERGGLEGRLCHRVWLR